MTEILAVDRVHPDPQAIAIAAAILRSGGLVAFPTETVYGLGANALDPVAVRRIFAAKERPAADPLIVHVSSEAQIRELAAAIPESVHALAARFWPGPLTIVLRRSARVPDAVTAGLDTVAIRVPAHPVARALLEAAALPVAAPSANLFSRPSPTRATHVIDDLDGRVDIVIDAGPTEVGVESTVLDLAHGIPTILRPGAVTLEMIRQVLPDARLAAPTVQAHDAPQVSPGLLEKHYAPRTPLTLYEGPDALPALFRDAAAAIGAGRRIGLLLASDDPEPPAGAEVEYVGSSRSLAQVASRLYAALRGLDARHLDAIFARGYVGDTGLAVALRDRLRRAAAGRVIAT